MRELVGRSNGEGAAEDALERTAVDGLELSACASYMSRNAVTDFLSCRFGARRTLFASRLFCEPAAELDTSGVDLLKKRPGSSFSAFCLLLCFLIVLGRRTCCGFVGKGVVVNISASVNSGLLSLCSLAAAFFCEGLRSCNGVRRSLFREGLRSSRGVRFGVVRFGVLRGVLIGEDMPLSTFF